MAFHLTIFAVISMERRNMSGIFIKIIITHTFNLVTGSNLKRWLQLDSLLQSKVVQATTETHVKQKLLVQL